MLSVLLMAIWLKAESEDLTAIKPEILGLKNKRD
jgi:hypothetical protein